MDEEIIPLPHMGPHKGRGAVSNRTPRFESETRHPIDDGWGGDPDLPPLRTTLTKDTSRTIIAKNDSPDVPFDQSINPYRGCEHGCIYCFARPSHAFLGLSPGLDFETRLFYKPDAAELLESELRHPRYRCQVLALGANTDCYQPVERELLITRRILEILNAYNHPVGIVTKSALVLRDRDILALMAVNGLVQVFVSVTTLDRGLARRLEPRAPTPPKRVETIRGLAEAGIPVGVLVAPVIPALTDSEMERIMETARDAGAQSASYVLLRLPREIKDLFQEWLETHAPQKAARVMNLVRETRGGRDNDPRFGTRMRGTGTYAQLIAERFRLAADRLGLDREHKPLNVTRFQPPARSGDQLSLFE